MDKAVKRIKEECRYNYNEPLCSVSKTALVSLDIYFRDILHFYSILRSVHRPFQSISFFFVINIFFSHITQHSIQNITKQNNKHILNISKSSQKGGREGRTIKTQKSLLYIITYIKQKTLPSINGRRLGPTDSRRCTFTCHYLQEATDPICFLHMCGVNQFWIIVFFAAVKPANNILFCIELIQRPESSLRRHKLGLTDQSIHSNDDKTRFTCVHRLMTTGHSQNICRKVPDDVVLHIWQFKFDCSFILNLL